MVTRFYFPPTRTTPVSPAFDSLWSTTTNVGRGRTYLNASRSAADAQIYSQSETSTTANLDLLCRQYVSDPLEGAQSITGTAKGQMRVRELLAAADAHIQISIRVVSYNGTSVRGTLYAGDTRTGLVNELTTTVRNQQVPSAGAGSSGVVTLSQVDALDGDRIVIEVGGRVANVTNASQSVAYTMFDGAASDLTAAGTETTALNGWVELSQSLTFQAVALAETLTDEFTTLSTATWAVAGGAVASSGVLVLDNTGGTGSVTSLDLFDLGSSYAVINLSEVPATGGAGTTNFSFGLSKALTSDSIAWEITGASGTWTMIANFYVNAIPSNTSQTFTLASYPWLRLRTDGSNAYWDYGTDGTNWTNFRTVTLAAMDAPDEQFYRLYADQTGCTGNWKVTGVNPSASTDATVTPAVVAVTTTVPSPALSTGATVAPSVVAIAVTVPAASPAINATVTPTTIAVVSTVPVPDLSTSSTVTPSTVPVGVAVHVPTLALAASITPSTVDVVAVVPSVVPSVATVITPVSVACTVAVDAPSVQVTSDATVTPDTVSAVVTVPAPSFVPTTTISPAVVTVVAVVEAPDVSTGSTITPASVAVGVAIPAAGPSVGATVAPATVMVTVDVPVVDVTIGATVTPAVVAVLASVGMPVVSTSSTITPDHVAVLASVPVPSLAVGGASIYPEAILAVLYVGVPVIAGAPAPPLLDATITVDRLTATISTTGHNATLTRA